MHNTCIHVYLHFDIRLCRKWSDANVYITFYNIREKRSKLKNIWADQKRGIL